ncbi:outer membrane beta-barrel protein [uncultured Duncaniella sp.]|uniref:outer membrane beta-barrel protein n=1 Tax=uncultured Duncaniella sp. TaxID=2768039 RepID=UPI0025A9A896|nr:outer membrane beta-barrel protein [uncultured Duncaniella sp.]
MKQLIGRLLLVLFFSSVTMSLSAKDDLLYLSGRVRDAITKADLTDSHVLLYDSLGNLRDSIKADRGSRFTGGEVIAMAYFGFAVPRVDSTYVFDVVCPGYMTETISYRVEKIGKRETSRSLPPIYLKREPRKLGEVTVTASKIKFYNKGDTLVFNADAFQLAEGSMLDALIAQLPGVELNDNGQIKVNGQYVESLLLNGKEFLDGNNQLMLENIGAYTVKNIEVYEGQTKLEKWRGDPDAEKHLTMDVKLKKEYNIGLILNAQGGYGTEDRYMGRLFASWFSPTTKLTLIGNINNLNDNRKPGKSDTWTPEMMPSGTREYKMGAFNYDYENPEQTRSFNGYVNVEENSTDNRTTLARTNFLSGGNTFDNSFSRGKNRQLKVETRNYYNSFTEKFYYGGMLLGRYIKRENNSSSISATFDKEQTDLTYKALEALYSDGSPERLDAVINRSITRSDGSRHESEVQFYPTFEYKIPQTDDRLRFQVGVKYKDEKEERWRDYNINYGADPNPAVTRRQYFDNSPNQTFTLDATAEYRTFVSKVNLGFTYSYRFLNRDRDSYMYALDQLTDMGIYGTLPGGYLDSFDPDNSYTSRLIENKHDFGPELVFRRPLRGNTLLVCVNPTISLLHQHFDYWRANRSYLVSRSSMLYAVGRYSARIDFSMDRKPGKDRRSFYRHQFIYEYRLDTKTPDLVHLIDIVNDSDPLNISLGNPDLKNAYVHNQTLTWNYKAHDHPVNNTLLLGYELTSRALVRGYTYDTSTGVRRNRTYNVDGNNVFSAHNNFNLQFGAKQEFMLSSSTDGQIINSADMIGVNLEAPEESKVSTRALTQGLKFGWQIGKQSLQFGGKYTNRHTTSSREDFNTINANHYNYGIIGQFILPGGFGINTDFMLYTRSGYGVRELDTTDAIWNLRMTYTPKGGRWVFMVDGFDMLRQLSNVNYAVNAQGRTVSYTNALPRYILFSVQYRINKQPRKR